MENRKSCTHIKISGIRCGSPSLRGEQFCYYHQRMHRGVRTPPQSRLHPLACIEDKESIQAALAEVINALLRNTIDMKRATLILRALHIAVKNDARASARVSEREMVKEVPEYDETAPSHIADGLIDLDVPFEASDGQDPRASRPQRAYKTAEQFEKDRDEMIANYYGFPTAEAHAAAKEKGWPPTPKPKRPRKKLNLLERMKGARVGTASQAVQADQQYRSAAQLPQAHSRRTTSRNPPRRTLRTPA